MRHRHVLDLSRSTCGFGTPSFVLIGVYKHGTCAIYRDLGIAYDNLTGIPKFVPLPPALDSTSSGTFFGTS